MLDTAIDPDFQLGGSDSPEPRAAADEASARRLQWLHVDFESKLANFYRRALHAFNRPEEL